MGKLNSYYGMSENDYSFAKNSLATCESLGNYNVIASLCAQAEENFLKAMVEVAFDNDSESIQLLHSHNLRAIYNEVIQKYDLLVTSRDCKWLGDFYFDARYPGDNFVIVNRNDAEECLNIVEQLMQDCKKIISTETKKREEERDALRGMKAFN